MRVIGSIRRVRIRIWHLSLLGCVSLTLGVLLLRLVLVKCGANNMRLRARSGLRGRPNRARL